MTVVTWLFIFVLWNEGHIIIKQYKTIGYYVPKKERAQGANVANDAQYRYTYN